MNAPTFAAKCRSILSDNAGRRHIPGFTSGKLDTARLSRLASGSLRVFRRPYRSRFARYAVEILVDASGSMYGNNRTPAAAHASHAVYSGLTSAGASVRVRMFNTRLYDPFGASELATPDTLLSALNRGATSFAASGNHDAYALTCVTRDLAASSAPGKIVLALSDGQPSCDNADGKPGCFYRPSHSATWQAGGAALRLSISRARASGIIVLALSIQTDFAVNLYGVRATRRVDDLDQVYPAMASLLDRHITRG